MSTASFDTACLFVLANEGSEYTNYAADAGGPTRWGVTLEDYSTYMGRKMTANDVKIMPQSVAMKILKNLYWISSYEKLAQPVATVILDWCFLHGNTSGRMMAQKAANELGAKLVVDGDIGGASIAALNALTPAYFISRFEADIKAYFYAIVAHAASQKIFLAGWLARANRYSSLV